MSSRRPDTTWCDILWWDSFSPFHHQCEIMSHAGTFLVAIYMYVVSHFLLLSFSKRIWRTSQSESIWDFYLHEEIVCVCVCVWFIYYVYLHHIKLYIHFFRLIWFGNDDSFAAIFLCVSCCSFFVVFVYFGWIKYSLLKRQASIATAFAAVEATTEIMEQKKRYTHTHKRPLACIYVQYTQMQRAEHIKSICSFTVFFSFKRKSVKKEMTNDFDTALVFLCILKI